MWSDDRLLACYQAHSWPVTGASPADGEPDEVLTATLVRRNAPRRRRAVLYVHGWNDYFFQTHLADFWDAQGFDFYAVDLRRYGRNLRPGLFAGFITDLGDYGAELGEAYRIIAGEGHEAITLMGHSTGGLIAALWAADFDQPINGLVLNSPWLDSRTPDRLRWAVPLVNGVAAMKPTAPIQTTETGLYMRSVSDQYNGEWPVDLDYKSNKGFVVRFGWARAVLAGQARIAAGLGLRMPVLAMMSARSDLSYTTWDDEIARVDVVLDADRLAAAAWRLGSHLMLVRVDGGMHDLTLSARPIRDEVFAEMARWAAAYLA